jgi:hypothetical protein
MNTDHRIQNPYAAPESTEVSTDTIASHQNFMRVGNKVRCRSGLQLPPYCLVTGVAEDLLPLPLSLWAPGKSLRRYRFGGIGLMLAVPIVSALAFLFGAGPPADPFLIVLFISALLILGLVLFLLGGRRGQMCILQGVVDRRRLVWGRRFAAVPSWFLVLFLAASVTMGWNSGYGFSLLLLFSVLGQLFSNLVFLRGTQLRAVVADDGVFELSGFSKAFLKRLEESSNAS